MKTWFAVILLLLASCGGGKDSPLSRPPKIQGMVLGFSLATTPANLPNAIVSVLNPYNGASITDATVTVNGVALTFNSLPSHDEYEGTVQIVAGSQVTLTVTAAGKTYSSSGTQPISYPALTAPSPGNTWGASSANTVSWSIAASPGNTYYLLSILDAADPFGALPYFKTIPTNTTSYSIPANSLTTGNKDVILGLMNSMAVSNASTDSGFIIGGFGYVPVSVIAGTTPTTQPPSTNTTPVAPPVPIVTTLTSLAVSPPNITLATGATGHLKAVGTYSDNSTQNLTSQVAWQSSDPTKTTIDAAGLITAISNGTATITASLGNVSASMTATVFQPTSVATDWATFQGNAGHTGYVDVQLDPTVFKPIWTWSAPPNTGGNPVRINSVATSSGKVFVSKDIYFDQAVLYALNEADGTASWTYSLGTMASEGPPAVANGSVFLPSNSPSSQCVMWAINATLGTYQFQMPSTCQWSGFFAPTALDGSVVQTSQAGMVNSYSIIAGGLQWSNPAYGMDQSTPAIGANYVYQYGGANGGIGLKVIDKFTGELVSTITDPFTPSFSFYSLFSAPMLGANGNVINFSGAGFSGLASSSSEQYQSRILVNYNIAGKTYAWRSANAYLTHPAIANGVIYASRNTPATFDAISEATGQILWSWTPPAVDTSFHRNTIVTRNLAFVSTDMNVYAIDLATHQSVWRYGKPGMLAISGNNVLYIVTGATLSDGNLVAIRLK